MTPVISWNNFQKDTKRNLLNYFWGQKPFVTKATHYKIPRFMLIQSLNYYSYTSISTKIWTYFFRENFKPPSINQFIYFMYAVNTYTYMNNTQIWKIMRGYIFLYYLSFTFRQAKNLMLSIKILFFYINLYINPI